jgi:N-acetylglucosamine-6-sulfatase
MFYLVKHPRAVRRPPYHRADVPTAPAPMRIARLAAGLAAIALIVVTLAAAPLSVLGQAPTQPDVIVVMVDDLGDLPDDQVLTSLEHIRETFIVGGMRFRQMYDETPLCCPARASFLSGQHTLRHGVVENQADPFDQSVTIATELQRAGYHTILAGKYLNGYDGPPQPPGWDRVLMLDPAPTPSFWLDGELVRFPDRFVDDVTREHGVAWLREAATERPVFALLAPEAPHRDAADCARGDDLCRFSPSVMEQDRGAPACASVGTFTPPSYAVTPDRRERPIDMPDFLDGWPLQPICESLLVVDRMVGEIVDAQAARGRPAVLVFMSDHGMAWGQKGYPLKHVPYAARMPFYVSGTGIPAGTTTDALYSMIDVPVTIAELAGVQLPSADGTSFAERLTGAEGAGRDELIQVMPPPPSDPEAYPGWEAIMTPTWWYIRWQDGRQELYRYRDDPWLLEDLTAAHPDVVAQLAERLECLMEASAVAEDTASGACEATTL